MNYLDFVYSFFADEFSLHIHTALSKQYRAGLRIYEDV